MSLTPFERFRIEVDSFGYDAIAYAKTLPTDATRQDALAHGLEGRPHAFAIALYQYIKKEDENPYRASDITTISTHILRVLELGTNEPDE